MALSLVVIAALLTAGALVPALLGATLLSTTVLFVLLGELALLIAVAVMTLAMVFCPIIAVRHLKSPC